MTHSIRVYRWSDFADKELSESAVRERFPSAKYRVSVYRYPPSAKLTGATRQATCHVLSGVARYTFDDEVTVRPGDVADLPEGQYSLEVVGNDELVIVLCWELPFAFNSVQ